MHLSRDLSAVMAMKEVTSGLSVADAICSIAGADGYQYGNTEQDIIDDFARCDYALKGMLTAWADFIRDDRMDYAAQQECMIDDWIKGTPTARMFRNFRASQKLRHEAHENGWIYTIDCQRWARGDYAAQAAA